MTTQSNKPGALDNYVTVAERIAAFYNLYSAGKILTQVIEHDRESGFVMVRAEVYRNSDDATPAATGHAYEYKDAGYVQRGSYIEVAETSAVGRALAFLNFETKRGIASREEMEKFTAAAATRSERAEETTTSERSAGDEGARARDASRSRLAAVAPAPARPATERAASTGSRTASADAPVTDDQKEEILILLEEIYPNDRRAQKRALTEATGKQSRDDLTQAEARRLIAELKKRAIP